jgi:hypothetical protein
MPELLRPALQLATGAALLILLLVVTHVTGSDPAEGAALRIAIRTTAGTMEDCHKLSAEELEKLPMHMRRPEVCESRAVPYRLQVHVGDRSLVDRTYTAAGIRGDRPLTVDEEFTVPAGSRDVTIRFTPALATGTVQSGRSDGGANPQASPAFVFDDAVEFLEGRVRVATLDTKAATFEIR